MQNNCIKNLLNFKEVVIKNIKNLKDSVEVYAELLISEQTCPCCSTKTSKIHDHYVQPIKDIPIHLKPTTIFLRKNISASNIAKSLNIDSGFISKLLPYLSVSTSSLSRVLCIDKFKGNSGKYKYQVALLDGESHKVINIIECRHKHFLCDYFKKFPKEQLDNVKFLVSDLWEPYKDICITYFRKAKIVADHFHWVRYACNALDKI